MSAHAKLLQEFQELARIAPDVEKLMQRISDRLHAEFTRYNWVGFYLVDEANPRLLVLGPHTGSFTPHERIPFEQGLCGAAATSGKTVIVHNVADDKRYLSGSGIVKSEIVVPILASGKLSCELDVESYFTESFRADEESRFVEACAQIVADYLHRTPVVLENKEQQGKGKRPGS
jgi:L-methionine (R)-S-oxide reductase